MKSREENGGGPLDGAGGLDGEAAGAVGIHQWLGRGSWGADGVHQWLGRRTEGFKAN